MRCIICKETKPAETFTKEHVFPDSIGGTLVINSVCKDCNDFLGRSVDAHLVNHKLTQLARLVLKISGKKGRVPNPLERGHLSNNPKLRLNFVTDDSGKPKDVYFGKNVTREKGDNKELIDIVSGKKDEVINTVNTIIKRRGLPSLSKEEIEQYIEEQSYTQPEMCVRLDMDVIRYHRAIIKIAYEMAYYWLGQRYLDDSIGELLRLCILDNSAISSFTDKYPIQGTITIRESKSTFPLGTFWDNDKYSHLAIMMKHENDIACYIRIFQCFEAIIGVSKTASSYTGFKGKFLQLNPQTGATRETNLENEIWQITAKLK